MIRKIKREKEKKNLRIRIKELLGMLELTKKQWKNINLKVEGKGIDSKPSIKHFSPKEKHKWGRHIKGGKPSLKAQYSVLFDLYQENLKNKEFFDKLKSELDKKKEMENNEQQ